MTTVVDAMNSFGDDVQAIGFANGMIAALEIVLTMKARGITPAACYGDQFRDSIISAAGSHLPDYLSDAERAALLTPKARP